MSNEGSCNEDSDSVPPTDHRGVTSNSAAQSPVASLPDVVTASHAVPATIYQQYQSNTLESSQTITQSSSQPESLAGYHSQPGSPQRQQSAVTSESTPTSPQHLGSQATGQIGFTIDFDDTGVVSWNLKSDINKFLPSSRKLKMEERRSAVKELKAHPVCLDQSQGTENENQNNDREDLLSEAGTYIIDNAKSPQKAAGNFVESKNGNSNKEGPKREYIDLETHEFTIGQSSLMESFLDHAAASFSNVEAENLSAKREVQTESEDETSETGSAEVKAGQEEDDSMFATFSRNSRPEQLPKVQSSKQSNFSAIPRSAVPLNVTAIKAQLAETHAHQSVTISDLSQSHSSPYSASQTSGSLTSSRNTVPHSDQSKARNEVVFKDNLAYRKSEGAPVRNVSSAKRPSSANARKPAKIDVDRRLVEMEEALKKNFKVSVGMNVLAKYNSEVNDKESSPRNVPPRTSENSAGLGNFNRLAPIRKSAGPRFAGSKQSDVKSLSSNSDVFEDNAKGKRTVRVGPPASPTASIKMNKAMKLRMMKHSEQDDRNDCISMTSDGTSAKSQNRQLSFARANPMYKSLPAKRPNAQQSQGSNASSKATPALSKGLTRPSILPNKTNIAAKSATAPNANKQQGSAKRQENVTSNYLPSPGGARTPDETNLSTFDKLVLSSIDQLSKKLNINSSQLVSLCQKNDSFLLSAGRNENSNLDNCGKKGAGDAGSDIPKLKTGCQEISAILYELRVVEKNIEHATRHLNAAIAYCNGSQNKTSSLDQSLDNSGNFEDSLVDYF